MTDENQFIIPPSFIALYVPEGRTKPNASRDDIATRYEFCEDLATLLTEQASTTRWELGITERDVLERVRQGLNADSSTVTPPEADWIVRRLAELLDWSD